MGAYKLNNGDSHKEQTASGKMDKNVATADMTSDVEKPELDDDPVILTISDGKLAAEKQENESADEKVDLYDIKRIQVEQGPKWAEMTPGERAKKVILTSLGLCTALGLLYVFICSLDILTAAFQLLAGRVAGDALSNNVVLSNPIAGLVLGVLCTVLVQSSSTSTSIVVTMVGAGVLDVEQGIYLIMGANIGTSVTNTIVSLSQSGDKETFRRSFAGATVHDMFNWLTVLVILPIEVGAHYLYHLTSAIVKHIDVSESHSDEPEFLKVITEPLTSRIIKVDKAVLSDIAEGSDRAKYPICKYYCDFEYDSFNVSWPTGQANQTFIEEVRNMPWTINIAETNTTALTYLSWDDVNDTRSGMCTHHFTGCGVEDTWCNLPEKGVGGILLACALVIMLTAVILLVKVLNLILKGPMARAIQVAINSNLPGKAKFLTGYLAILLGAGLTMLVQSSSVFTSTMTPLVGIGLISVDRMFPLTLGANIGTCLTGLLAALASDPAEIRNTMQVALAHLFFNLSGIVLVYPVPHIRKLPILAAKFLGNVTADYRWFAVAYLVVLFFLLPGAIFGLSLAGWRVLVGVLVPIVAVIIAVIVIKLMQRYCPLKMHPCMRNWQWLPKPLRSLEPCNNAIMKCCYNKSCVDCRKKCCSCCKDDDVESDELGLGGNSSSSSTWSVKTTSEDSKPPEYSVDDEFGQQNPAYQGDDLESTRF